ITAVLIAEQGIADYHLLAQLLDLAWVGMTGPNVSSCMTSTSWFTSTRDYRRGFIVGWDAPALVGFALAALTSIISFSPGWRGLYDGMRARRAVDAWWKERARPRREWAASFEPTTTPAAAYRESTRAATTIAIKCT